MTALRNTCWLHVKDMHLKHQIGDLVAETLRKLSHRDHQPGTNTGKADGKGHGENAVGRLRTKFVVRAVISSTSCYFWNSLKLLNSNNLNIMISLGIKSGTELAKLSIALSGTRLRRSSLPYILSGDGRLVERLSIAHGYRCFRFLLI